MSNKLKVTFGVIAGVIGAVLLFCLVVSIGCAANGLKFGEQITKWFNPASTTATNLIETARNTVNFKI